MSAGIVPEHLIRCKFTSPVLLRKHTDSSTQTTPPVSPSSSFDHLSTLSAESLQTTPTTNFDEDDLEDDFVSSAIDTTTTTTPSTTSTMPFDVLMERRQSLICSLPELPSDAAADRFDELVAQVSLMMQISEHGFECGIIYTIGGRIIMCL